MPRDARFWRNVTIIAVAHLAIVVALVRWNREMRNPNLQSIVWMNGGDTAAAPDSTATKMERAIGATLPPPADTPRSKLEEQDQPPVSTLARSDIHLPAATPSPPSAATPPSKPSMISVPKASPKPTPKAQRKIPVVAKVAPKPPLKGKVTPAEHEKKNDENSKEAAKITPAVANGAGGEKSGSTGVRAALRAEFSWYGKMLHDRFHSEWIQPTSSVAIGAKMSALVRIRIEKDGRVSNFTIVRPSGNVLVDESVAAVAKRVTLVDPLPRGLGSGPYYEVNINFELNP